MVWVNETNVEAKQFRCGQCGREVGSARGFSSSDDPREKAYVCPICNALNIFRWFGHQIPSALPGAEVDGLPDDVKNVYVEARSCFAAGAFTGAVLLTRKLLMNISVSHGAKEGETFAQYINFLDNAHFIPPGGKQWVDHIRQKGNEATHEIAIMSKADAEDLLAFAQGLLQFIYEFPRRIAPK